MTSSNSSRRRLTWVNPLLWLFVFIGVATGIRSAVTRWNEEQNNRRVEIAVDMSEMRTLATADGVPLNAVLQQFRAAGVNSIALQEETIGGIEESRLVRAEPISVNETRITPTLDTPMSEKLLARIQKALLARSHFAFNLSSTSLTVEQPWPSLRSVGMGLDPEYVRLIHDAGLGIVGRVSNWTGVSSTGIQAILGDLSRDGAKTVLFSGDEVLGFKGFVTTDSKDLTKITTDQALRANNLFYGAIEFGKQKGDPQLALAAPDRIVRVHTITSAEMVTETLPDAVQRFSLAARERNIRLLFVRLFLDEPDAVAFNADYIGKIARQLHHGNLETGSAHGYSAFAAGVLPRLMIGLGVAAGFLLLCDAIFGLLSGGISLTAGAICWMGALILIGLAGAPSATGVKLAALAAALIFPSLGLLVNDLLKNETPFSAIGRFLFACLITSFGIASVVGLLASEAYLVKADAFIGIKATLAVPLLLVGLVYSLNLRADAERTFARAVRDCGNHLARLALQPILVWQIIGGTCALGIIFIILSRSGNEGSVGVSGLELKIRAVLDNVFLARPRFKDVFGHAAMICSLLLFQKTRVRTWAMPLFLLGIFGQVSLLNTFCHLHTPLSVSLWRAFLGIALGGSIGGALFALLNIGFDRGRTAFLATADKKP